MRIAQIHHSRLDVVSVLILNVDRVASKADHVGQSVSTTSEAFFRLR